MPGVSELLADFLRDLDDPNRNVEENSRAAQETGRDMPTGYTGLEGLLNYVYYQAGTLNQYDPTSHLLHFSIFSVETPCQQFNAGGQPGSEEFGVPASGGGHTTDGAAADRCVSWLGPNQPGINQDLGLPPYDPSVCPEGSSNPELCNPSGRSGRNANQAEVQTTDQTSQQPGYTPPTSTAPGEQSPGGGGTIPGLDLPGSSGGELDDLLDIPGAVEGASGTDGTSPNSGGGEPSQELLDFLFSN